MHACSMDGLQYSRPPLLKPARVRRGCRLPAFATAPDLLLHFVSRLLYCPAEGRRDGNTANALASFDASQASRSDPCCLFVSLTT